MAEKAGGNLLNKVSETVKLLYTIVEKQEQYNTKLLELSAEMRALREHYANLDRQVGELEGRFKGIDAKIEVVEQKTIAQLYKVKDEVKDELRKAVDEMKSDLCKTKSDLNTEFADHNAELKLLLEYLKTSRNPAPLPPPEE